MWRKYDVTVMTLICCDSVCCMCGEAWSSRWLMTQLINGQHACVLVFVPMVDILHIPCDFQFVFSVLDEHRAWRSGNILRVHYKSMKCKTPFTRYNRLSVRLSNRFDNRFANRLNKQPLFIQPVVKPCFTTGLTTGCIHDTAGCQTGC